MEQSRALEVRTRASRGRKGRGLEIYGCAWLDIPSDQCWPGRAEVCCYSPCPPWGRGRCRVDSAEGPRSPVACAALLRLCPLKPRGKQQECIPPSLKTTRALPIMPCLKSGGICDGTIRHLRLKPPSALLLPSSQLRRSRAKRTPGTAPRTQSRG